MTRKEAVTHLLACGSAIASVSTLAESNREAVLAAHAKRTGDALSVLGVNAVEIMLCIPGAAMEADSFFAALGESLGDEIHT
jgi:hypothetical protein